MIKHILTFKNDEIGAVTVDWVVLTAAIIFVTISAFMVIQQASGDMGAAVGTYLAEADQDALRNPNQ